MCSENHDHDWIKQEFPSLEAAKDWILAQELDQLFTAVTFRNGYGVYSCRHREKPEKRAAKDQSNNSEVKRNRSRLTPHGCKAGFKLRKVMRCSCVDFVAKTLCFHQEILFELRGCLTHSHPVERKSRRISQVTKNLLMSLLEAGVPKSVIKDKYCRPSDSDNSDAKFVTLQDLTNFENALKKTKLPTKSSTPDSSSQLDPTIASVSDETPILPVKSIVLPFSIEVEPTSICISGPDGKSTTDFNWLDLTDSDLLDSTSTNDEDLTSKAYTSVESSINPVPECVPQPKKSDDPKPIIDFNWIELAASSKISKFDQAIPSPSMKPLTPQVGWTIIICCATMLEFFLVLSGI